MRSDLGIWIDVKAGKLTPQTAIKLLKGMPGGTNTQTYRRVERFAKQTKDK